ncbi:MAG: histidine--tRNA ligase [Clostridiales Family XIII bacterium]|jgi:histidyl-tRNA synthetase|nr:histidine--tRNA ligase [Clostridiales Family XIII bacterium]
MIATAPKGTKDVLPGQIHAWRHVEESYREACRRFGFQEIRTPVFEHTELFSRGVGGATDIVEKQMYTFDDRAGRSLTLRPEGTASVARAFVENRLYAEMQPSKYFYGISCFRYEKPQLGRLREFHQLGAEIFGAGGMLADAEVICLAADFLGGLGIGGLDLRVNSVGCPSCRPAYRELLRDFLRPSYDGLCETCRKRLDSNPMRILDCKSPRCREIAADAPRMLGSLCGPCASAFDELKGHLVAAGLAFTVDAGIVRGLDYYTKTAFEFVSDGLGAQDTVCGGGRYDGLIEDIGGPGTPGVGFALGVERLLLAMESSGAKAPEPEGADAFIAAMGDGARAAALGLMRRLRGEGLRVEMDCLGRNIKGQMKLADRLNARYALIIGDDELRDGVVTIKDMRSGEQRPVGMRDAASFLRRRDVAEQREENGKGI